MCNNHRAAVRLLTSLEGFTGEYRANAACYNCWAYARGSGNYIGLYSTADSASLWRTGPQHSVRGVCP
jgi:hypothetical protein